MRIFSSKPLNFINGKIQVYPHMDIRNEEIYTNMWLLGDEKEEDINSLIKQNRIHK